MIALIIGSLNEPSDWAPEQLLKATELNSDSARFVVANEQNHISQHEEVSQSLRRRYSAAGDFLLRAGVDDWKQRDRAAG